jgi:hypothetical protein
MLVRHDPPVIGLAQPGGEPQALVRVAVEVRLRAAAQQSEGERDIRAGGDVQ